MSSTTAPSASLSPEETRRYGRHLVLPHVGPEGQGKLKAARVLLVGAGGLGSPAALYLAAAGVGTLGLVDFDRVDETNLQRQVLFSTGDVGRPKVEAASERLRDLNPHVALELHAERLDASNVRRLVESYDVVVDGSDNFPTRYLLNDACVLAGTPCVWGAVLHFEGQLSVFAAPGGPCYRCLFPEPPPAGLVPSCAEAGVLGVLPGTIGTLQATETLKLILGEGEPMIGRFLVFDALRLTFREIHLPRNPECPACGEGAEPELSQPDAACSLENEAMSQESDMPLEIDVHELHAWRQEGLEHVLLDVREEQEHQLCHIEGSRLIPMGQLQGRLDELDREAPIVVHCHHGPRSTNAVYFLRSQGFTRATNLRGGIEEWSVEIDPSVPRY